MKYIALVEYYPNCPSCDSGYASHLEFFNTTEEIMDYVLKTDGNEYQIKDIYVENKIDENIRVVYNTHRHSVHIISFHNYEESYKIVDDGKGNKIWSQQ